MARWIFDFNCSTNMTSEQQTPDRSFGQAVILHFTVFCVLLIPSQHLSGLGGVQRKLAFQFFQGGEFGFRPRNRTGTTSFCP